MATYSGRNSSVKLGTYLITELGSWKLTMTRAEIDTTAFGSTWEKSDVGFGKWTASFDGHYDMTDTNGQIVLKTAFLAGSLVTNMRLYVDNTSYYCADITTDTNAGGRVTTYDISAAKNDVAKLTINISGCGPIALV